MCKNYNSLSAGRDTWLKNGVGGDVGSPPMTPKTSRASWLVSLSILFLLIGNFVNAQTTLVSPTGDGGFENGATFVANGWSVVNPATDAWSIGTATAAASGTQCGYISAN